MKKSKYKVAKYMRLSRDDGDMKKIEERAKEILSLDNITKEMYQKLIERIEFDKEKNIFIKFKFAKYTEK